MIRCELSCCATRIIRQAEHVSSSRLPCDDLESEFLSGRPPLLALLDSRATLLSYSRFAEKHDLHLVVDEVYGMSVFSTEGTHDRDSRLCRQDLTVMQLIDPHSGPEFTSVLSLDYAVELEGPFDRSRVHVSMATSEWPSLAPPYTNGRSCAGCARP